MDMNKGFTLIEIMTALAVFLIVMTISMGSIVGIFDINRKSQSLKIVMSNLNLSIESMAREMRFSKRYHCGALGDLASPNNCPAGDSAMSFLTNENKQFLYRLNGTRIEKSEDGGLSFIPVTAPEITIEDLEFFVLGAGAAPTNTLQPKVFIKIKGYAGTKESSRTDFVLQTLVSQRELDS